MVIHNHRNRLISPEFPYKLALRPTHRSSRLRFSVALPLGINAPTGRFTASLYPKATPSKTALPYFCLTLVGRAPGRNGNSRRASGVLRASRGEASGPRDPKGRKSSTNKSTQTTTKGSIQFFRFRAAASGPGIKDAPPQARRLYESRKHRTHSTTPILRGSSSGAAYSCARTSAKPANM